MKTKISIFSKLVIWALILSPILQIYGYGSISLTDLIITFLILISICIRKISFKLPRYIHQYFYYFFIVTIVSCLFDVHELVPRLIGIFRTYLKFCLFFSNFYWSYFYKRYKQIILLVIIVFVAQEISYRTTGLRISGLIPFLPLISSFENMEGSFTFYEHLALINRSASLFSEPAIMVQYILPFFAVSLFQENGKSRILFAGASALTILFSFSGNGIIGLSVILIVYSIRHLKKINVKTLVLIISIIGIIGVTSFASIKNSETVKEYSSRVNEIKNISSSMELSSGFYRIYRGYYVYGEYNFFQKVFGIYNFSRIREKIEQCEYSYTFDENDMYFNSIQNFLIKTGIIGLILFICFLCSLYKGNDYCSKSIILTLLVLSFIASIYLNDIMVIYLLIPYYFKKKLYVQKSNSYTD